MGKFKALFAILLSAVLIAGAFYWLRRYKPKFPSLRRNSIPRGDFRSTLSMSDRAKAC